MTQVPYLGIRTPPRGRSTVEPWEAYVRSEYPGRDTAWLLAAVGSTAGARPRRPSLLARALRRIEAWEHRLLRTTVPGIATELSLPTHAHGEDAEAECLGPGCTEALKDRTAMGPR